MIRIIKVALSNSLRMLFASLCLTLLRREKDFTSSTLASLDLEVLDFSSKAVNQLLGFCCLGFFLNKNQVKLEIIMYHSG